MQQQQHNNQKQQQSSPIIANVQTTRRDDYSLFMMQLKKYCYLFIASRERILLFTIAIMFTFSRLTSQSSRSFALASSSFVPPPNFHHRAAISSFISHRIGQNRGCIHVHRLNQERKWANGKNLISSDRFKHWNLYQQLSIHDDVSSASPEQRFEVAQKTVSFLAQKNKTWKRLSNFLDLIQENPSSNHNTQRATIADIGCDHGLLAIALAVSGHFDQVIGVDVSERALDNALDFHQKFQNALKGRNKLQRYVHRNNKHDNNINDSLNLPLDFRLGDGLDPLQPGEATSICIAGMGIESMISILHKQVQCEETNTLMKHLEYLQCKNLYLQPPTNQPKHLIPLYNTLFDHGWILAGEKIVYLRKRWYITSSFKRCDTDIEIKPDNMYLPGHFLSMDQESQDFIEFKGYVNHHLQWMGGDLKRKGNLSDEEISWQESFRYLEIEQR